MPDANRLQCKVASSALRATFIVKVKVKPDLRIALTTLLLTSLTGVAAILGFEQMIGAANPPALVLDTSTLALDRDGRLLRAFSIAGGRWRLPVALEDLDPKFLDMLLAFEDRRFREHPGVDPRALARALLQMVTNGRIVSGGSTISMQLVRLLEGESTRSAGGKIRQMLAALALERKTAKDDILEAYLTLAPYGGNIEGVRAAALAWLGKEPRRLTVAEAALLVALPQSPETRRPDRYPRAARRARDRVLARVRAAGILSEDEETAARGEPVPTRRRPFPMLAPHLTERLVRAHQRIKVHRTTLDARLQRQLERLAAERAEALGPGLSVAILTLDHRSGEVLACIGSAGLLMEGRDGYIDMTRAVRSPGSTLKPLIYGLAFESGLAHPESLVEDRPAGFAGYVPGNFDREFRGTVTVRRALQLSLNLPAVKVLEAVGPARLLSRLRRAGARPVLSDISSPGLAIGLGGIGLTLTDLVKVFAAIAHGGMQVVPRESRDDGRASEHKRRVLDERAAWHLGSILGGTPSPANFSNSRISFKTGTSYGYRDAWALGFDGGYLVGVWVGRPDAAPVSGLTGINAAAPILFDAFGRIKDPVPLPAAPPGVLIATTAELPPPLQRVRTRDSKDSGVSHPQIAFPPDGARVDLGIGDGLKVALALKVRNGSPPFNWLANGTPIRFEAFSRTSYWVPDGPGFTTLSLIDGRGLSSHVSLYVQ
jgi:penicillin-binding protein 1C